MHRIPERGMLYDMTIVRCTIYQRPPSGNNCQNASSTRVPNRDILLVEILVHLFLQSYILVLTLVKTLVKT
jgi:hypothetical protein